MVLLNINISNFRLTAFADSPLPSSCQLSLSTTTRRVTAVESPVVSPSPSSTPGAVKELVFPPAWSLQWSETLPDRLALRAAALHMHVIRISKPRFSMGCVGRNVSSSLGKLKLTLLSLANGTVCHSLRLRDKSGGVTNYALSFDVVIEEPCLLKLSISNVLVRGAMHASNLQLEIGYPACKSLSRSETATVITSGDNSLRKQVQWSRLPILDIHASSLATLAHSSLHMRLVNPADTSIALWEAPVPLHSFWAAFTHPTHAYPLNLQLSDISLTAQITSDKSPPNGQMVGGVTTDVAVSGAHPVIFGSKLSDTGRVQASENLPQGWVRLVDTFGYKYYHHLRSGVDVWTLPHDHTTAAALKRDDLRALQLGFERCKHGIFRCTADATETWIHPAATRVSASSYDAGMGDVGSVVTIPQEDSPPTSLSVSLSTIDFSDLHPAALTTRVNNPADEQCANGEVMRSRIVEMQWTEHSRRSYIPDGGLEGHSLTAVNGAKSLLLFGGSKGSGGARMNALHSLDVDSMTWKTIFPSGVSPAVRTGHGAVALGTDQSRLLIFGGSSPQGRRNDLHTFHVANETWSPVSCTGTPPGVRARMGMTVTNDGSTALVFGGRSLYKYLGGRYYDSLYVNAFHAERSQWVQMRPRGSGKRPEPRSGCIVEFVNGRHMIMHGGYDEGDRFFDDTYIFDIVSSSWQQLPYPDETVVPHGRESHASTVMGGQVVIYGGESRRGLQNDLNVFDSTRMRWTEQPNAVGRAPGKLCLAAMAAIDDSTCVLVGGDNGFSMSRSVYSMQVSHRSAIDANGMKELAMERGPDAGTCVVCLDAKVDTMFLWCGHSVCCRKCSKLVKSTCPICRKPFSEIVHSRFD